MTLSPDELIEQAKTCRDQAKEAAIKAGKEFDDMLDDAYKALCDPIHQKSKDDDFDKKWDAYLQSFEVAESDISSQSHSDYFRYVEEDDDEEDHEEDAQEGGEEEQEGVAEEEEANQENQEQSQERKPQKGEQERQPQQQQTVDVDGSHDKKDPCRVS